MRIYWSIRNWIEDFWEAFKHFCASKEHRAVVKEAFYGFSWDEAYLYGLIKAKLLEMKGYFSESDIAVHDYDDTVRWISKAVEMLDIIDESDGEWERVRDGNPRYVNQRNAFRFAYEVNCNNEKIPEENMLEMYREYPDELRKKKAQSLLMKILLEKGNYWWD